MNSVHDLFIFAASGNFFARQTDQYSQRSLTSTCCSVLPRSILFVVCSTWINATQPSLTHSTHSFTHSLQVKTPKMNVSRLLLFLFYLQRTHSLGFPGRATASSKKLKSEYECPEIPTTPQLSPNHETCVIALG